MKKYLIIGTILLILIIGLGISIKQINSLKRENEIAYTNLKAYSYENSNLQKDSRVFQLTIDQLESYNDSIFQAMNQVKKELKIKNKELARIEYIKQTSSKIDSILLTDTIFIKDVSIDTTITDPWYTLSLQLKYPSTIIVSPSFISELFIITSDKRETVKPPKKFFLWRWFQRKHTVRVVEVYDKSPYNQITNKKFVEIIK